MFLKGSARNGDLVRFFLFAVLAFGLILSPSPAWGAFGISPPFIHATHLVKGARYAQTIYLVQDQPNEDLKIQADIDVPESIRSWVTVDQGVNFVIPKGVRQFPVQVIIQVPKDTGPTAYQGKVVFTTSPGEAGQVTIALGAQVSLDIVVGEDIFRSFRVAVVKILDVEEGWNPRVYVKFDNAGNVPEVFDGATLELFDQFNAVRLAYIQKPKGFPETPPFTVKEYTVEFPTDFHLGIGSYWGRVNLYQNDKVIVSEKGVFNVLKSGSLSSPIAQLLQSVQNDWPYYLGGAAFLGIGFLLWRRRRHRLRKMAAHS